MRKTGEFANQSQSSLAFIWLNKFIEIKFAIDEFYFVFFSIQASTLDL